MQSKNTNPLRTLDSRLLTKKIMQKLQTAIIVDIIPQKITREEALNKLEELERLVETYGGITILKILQKRGRPSAKTYIGTGKAEEVAELQKELKADIVVINGFVKPNQFHHLTLAIDCEVLDRFELILQIFKKHARTEKARLQIDLAYLKYEFPRLFGKNAGYSQQKGGVGTVTRGKGEKILEVKRRHLTKQIKQIEKKLTSIQKVHAGQRKRRQKQGFKIASLVGYTNSGKTTLLRNTTHKKKAYAADKLFATLETKLGAIHIEDGGAPVLLSDTIGFISDLPPLLFESFKTTLEEALKSDLLIHVIDASDPKLDEKLKTVEEILAELDCAEKPRINVFNKIDRVKNPEKLLKKYKKLNPIPISALKKTGIEKLKKGIKTEM